MLRHSITPSAAVAPTEVAFNFAGTNTDPVATLIAITRLMSASLTPVLDIVALAATATGDGILHPGALSRRVRGGDIECRDR